MWWHEDDKPVLVRRRKVNKRKQKYPEQILMVNARITEKKQQFRQKVATVVVVLVSLGGVIWLIFTGTNWMGRWLFSHNKQFTIRHLDLASDGRLKPWHIREYGHLAENTNLFSISIKQVRKDLESVPLVKHVEVRRQLPDTLQVTVRERVALARLQSNPYGLPLAVDNEGFVLGPSAQAPHLPMVKGFSHTGLRPGTCIQSKDILDALEVLDLCDTTRISEYVNIQSIDVGDPEYLDVVLNDDILVRMSRNRFDWRLRKVAGILRANKQLGRDPVFITATGESSFPVQYQ